MFTALLAPNNNRLVAGIMGAGLFVYTVIWMDLGIDQLIEELNDIF